MTLSGTHSVGGVDGGPGLPVTGWSRQHGDVRVPHFVGLHALQVLPLLGYAVRRWRRAGDRDGQVMIALSMSYAGLFGLLLLNALRGNSVIAPDPLIWRRSPPGWFIGGWEVRDARSRGIRPIVIVPALALTFLLGPVGLLLYLGIRRSATVDP